MIQIVKSLLGKSDIEYNNELQVILSPDNTKILSSDEQDVFKYLSKEYNLNKQFPTAEVFLLKFPQYRHQLDEFDAFEISDLRYYRKQFITKHQNIYKSKMLHKMASDAVVGGITPEMADAIRKQTTFSEENEDEHLSFRERYTNSMRDNTGLKTYIDSFDEQIGSIAKGSVCTIAGFTGSFKTTWAVNIAIRNILESKKNIAYISLEVTKEQLEYSVFSLFSNDSRFSREGYSPIEHRSIRQNKLTEDELNFLCDKIVPEYQKDIEPYFHILDESKFKTFSESEILDTLIQLDDEKPLDAVIFDHAGLFAFKSPLYNSGNVGLAINKYTSFIREMSICFRIKDGKKKSIASIILAQTNRTGHKEVTKQLRQQNQATKLNNKNKTIGFQLKGYELNALSDANELERCSSIVMFVYANQSLIGKEYAYVQLKKTRYGNEIAPILVDVDAPYYKFGYGESIVEESELSADKICDLASSPLSNKNAGTSIIADDDSLLYGI